MPSQRRSRRRRKRVAALVEKTSGINGCIKMCGQMDRQLIGRQTGRWWWWWDGESLLSVTVICDSLISSSYVLRLNRNKSDRMNLCRQGRFFSSGRFAFSIWAGRNNWPYLDKDSKLLIQQEVSLSVMMLELRVFKEQIHTCSVVHLLSEITAAAGVISICHHEIQQEVLKCPDCPQKVPVRSTGDVFYVQEILGGLSL